MLLLFEYFDFFMQEILLIDNGAMNIMNELNDKGDEFILNKIQNGLNVARNSVTTNGVTKCIDVWEAYLNS
jgi:hypothetical protein